MTPDEVIPDCFRGELSVTKKGRPIFSEHSFCANGASGNDCQRGGCRKKEPNTPLRFCVFLNFGFVDFKKIVVKSHLHKISYRMVKSPTSYLKSLRNGRYTKVSTHFKEHPFCAIGQLAIGRGGNLTRPRVDQ